jgi:hypothetical protein
MAGAPGFEPGNGGIKIRCLTTWLRPKSYRKAASKRFRLRRRDHSGVGPTNQRPSTIYIHKRALTGLRSRLDYGDDLPCPCSRHRHRTQIRCGP